MRLVKTDSKEPRFMVALCLESDLQPLERRDCVIRGLVIW
jgi:hypothetical protein